MKQSADLPVRPFGAEPAAPAFAVDGAPPDALAAAPAIVLTGLASLSLLMAAPAAAFPAESIGHNHSTCPKKQAQPQPQQAVVATLARQIVRPAIPSGGGGGAGHWPRIAAELMP